MDNERKAWVAYHSSGPDITSFEVRENDDGRVGDY